jgi:hypothetical protein
VTLPAPPWGDSLDVLEPEPVAPAGPLSSYPARIGWAPTSQLQALGLVRDSLGRIRTKTGGYVCAWSGRLRTHHLYPVPWMDPWAGTVRLVWVDKDVFAELRRGILEGARARASGAVRSLLDGLFGQALRFLGGIG